MDAANMQVDLSAPDDIALADRMKHGQDRIRQELAALLLDGQQPDGSWKPGGQLPSQKRPILETTTVSTIWLTLALTSAGSMEQVASAVERAMKFIQQSPPGKSTEWYAVRLLLAAQTNDDALRDQLVKELCNQQQTD